MKIFKKSSNLTKIGFICGICLSFVAGFGVFPKKTAQAENRPADWHRYEYVHSDASQINIENNLSRWLRLRQGESINSVFTGSQSAIGQLRAGALQPKTMVAADFNLDGYPDLISGLAHNGGGILTLHRGSKEAFLPEDETVLNGLRQGQFPASFEREAKVIELPIAPDFIATGNFVKNSALDMIVASRSSRYAYLYTADEQGGFNLSAQIDFGGDVTALAADRFDDAKSMSGLTAGVQSENGAELVIFDGHDEIVSTVAERIKLTGEVRSLILAAADGTTSSRDLLILADGNLSRVQQIGKSLAKPKAIELPFRVSDFAAGEFIRDRRAKIEIAVLADDGNLYYLQNGLLDTRPYTESEVKKHFAGYGRGRKMLINADDGSSQANNWSVAEVQNLGVIEAGQGLSGQILQKARMTGNETDDLVILNPAAGKIRILFKEPNYDSDRIAFTGQTQIENIAFPETPLAVLPVRLNVMGQQGLAVLQAGKLEPVPVMFVPNATFTVSKTSDTNDGVCNADCSLREAVVASNTAAGADLITFAANGTYQLQLAGANENAAEQGDLDILESLTIAGNGSGSTILQAGTNTANGIDKVISINPDFTTAFATSLTGLTARFGRNPSDYSGDGFGGGLDWEASGTGTLSLTGVIITDNRTTDGDGGGITVTNTPGGAGNFTLSNSTISNNTPARTSSGASPIGGGIFVGTATQFALSAVTISGNSVAGSGGQGQGGGIFAFGPSGAGGTSTVAGTTFSSNSAPSDGGGFYAAQPVTFSGSIAFNSNSAGRFGGGLMLTAAGTTTLSKAVFAGNSATSGGAIRNQNGTLNMTFSRITGNTAASLAGLEANSGTSNVENNWWSCSTTPAAAPCNTVGTTGGTIDFSPWLQLRVTAATNPIVVGQTSGLTASFLLNSDGNSVTLSNLELLIGRTLGWSASGGSISGSQTTVQANGTATATFTGTAAGARSATATVDNGPTTVNMTVNKANTTLSGITDSNDPSVVGQPFTVGFTLNITAPGAGTPGGTVSVSDGTGGTCTATLPATSCNLTSTSAGEKTVSVTYNGDSNFNASPAGTTAHTVNKADTTASISSANLVPQAASVAGQTIVVNFTVSATAPGSGTPTGTVTVSDGVDSCNATVAAGQCTITLLTTGTRTLTATYAGDSNYNASVSTGFSQTVNKANTSASITGRSTTTTQQFESFTVSFAVSVDAPGSGTPTGTVTVSDGVDSCSATVAAGSCSLALTTVGSRSLVATYNGDGNYNIDDSPGASQTVLGPTAGSVQIGGRVLTADGRGIYRARVTLTDFTGRIRSTTTNSFGNFKLEDVRVGQNYTLNVVHKTYAFDSQVISVTDRIDGIRVIPRN